VQADPGTGIFATMPKGERGRRRGRKGGDPPAEDAELARLPPGRHGLSRDFVATNQRERLTAAMIACVAADGYQATAIADIARTAGVSRRTFYAYFETKEQCFLETYELIARHLVEEVVAAAGDEDDWPGRVRAGIGAALGFFAANPDLARFMLIAPTRAGEEIAARGRLSADRALAQLKTGMPDGVGEPATSVQDALIGGMVGLIARKVEAGEGERLPELLPDLVELFLGPFLGREEASRVAAATDD
jgi:AcrR family transcriptional regulator